MTHPGKKLLFMGQEFAQENEWNEDKEIEWATLEDPLHAAMHRYVKDLNLFYRKNEALWKLDAEPEGFGWTNCYSYEENIVAFARKSEYEEDDLLVVCNFTPVSYESFDIRVPYSASYKEVFNSDLETYGGKGIKNARAVKAKEDEEGKNFIIDIKILYIQNISLFYTVGRFLLFTVYRYISIICQLFGNCPSFYYSCNF